jgi:hypothetical protein
MAASLGAQSSVESWGGSQKSRNLVVKVSTKAEDMVNTEQTEKVRASCSELQRVWISDGAVVTFSYDL